MLIAEVKDQEYGNFLSEIGKTFTSAIRDSFQTATQKVKETLASKILGQPSGLLPSTISPPNPSYPIPTNSIPSSSIPPTQSSTSGGINKALLIGGAVAVGIVLLIILKKRKSSEQPVVIAPTAPIVPTAPIATY